MLELHGITKRFADRVALDEVSMTLSPGQLTGFVGANGAGKTTTMRIVMGLLEPDSGQLTWQGMPLDALHRRRFGYMPEERGLYPKQAVREQLVYFGRLHGMSGATATRRATELLDTLGLADRAADRIEQLSLGNQQRVQIAVALMHHPTALVLDEPFSGLDPAAVDTMADLVTGCARDGVPVLFSSHQLDLVERLCDHIVIISQGSVVAAGTAEKLRAGRERVFRITGPTVAEIAEHSPAGIVVKQVVGDSVFFVPRNAGDEDRLLRDVVRAAPVSFFGEVLAPLSEIYAEAVA
jgi:ABC-2 type transport system ATP-binding protein